MLPQRQAPKARLAKYNNHGIISQQINTAIESNESERMTFQARGCSLGLVRQFKTEGVSYTPDQRSSRLKTMSDDNNPKLPSHRVYTLIERSGDDGEVDTFWLNIGSAWPHKDGKGFSITLEAQALDGKLVLRVLKEKPEPAPKKARSK